MKILAICPAIPAQDAKGFQVQAYYRLLHLARNHLVNVVCFGDGDVDEARKRVLTEVGINVCMLPWRRTTALISVFMALFGRDIPIQCALFSSSSFRSAIQNSVNNVAYDLVLATTVRVMPNLVGIDIPVILDLVDSMALNFRRRVARASFWIRPVLQFEQSRVARYERIVAKNSVANFVVSALDCEEIGASNVYVCPLGVDTERFRMGCGGTSAPVVILSGNMSYQPNIEAAVWFVEKCWPIIKSKVPQATFVIAGSRPAPEVQRLAIDNSIYVTGQVPSMVDVLCGAKIAIAPMQSGSGMQFKILEAMACGIPVITSTIGLGGIKAKPGVDLLVCDSPSEFISTIIYLLDSEEFRGRIGNSGLEYIRENHSWDSINKYFESTVMKSVLGKRELD